MSDNWLHRSAHVEDIRTEDDKVSLLVRHHCHNGHEHRAWVPAPSALATRQPPYTVVVTVNRDRCEELRLGSHDGPNTAGLLLVLVAVLVIAAIAAVALL